MALVIGLTTPCFPPPEQGLGLFDLSGYGPRPEVFDTTPKDHHWAVAGFQLRRAPRTPDLDSPCGSYLTYRQFIQCGETQARMELAKAIPGRIDPKRDQHAAHEHHRNGRPICERRGAAVDFLIDDENMLEVAQWVVTNTPFDRLYFYGKDLPIHVSHGPNHDRQIVLMLPNADGRRVPRVMGVEAFLALAHRD